MANPKPENGHIDIANELAEAFARYFPGKAEAQILWAILRKTYGWHKKEDEISIGQLMDMTKLSRRMVIYSLQNLEAKKIIIIKRKKKTGGLNETNIISFQKDYDKWVVQEKTKQYRNMLESRKKLYKKNKLGVVQEIEGSARNGRGVVQEPENLDHFLHPQKKLLQKKLLQKRKEYTSFSKNENEEQEETFYLTKKNRKLTGERLIAFDQFWDVFDYKSGKADAADAWLDIPILTQNIMAKILTAAKIEAQNRPSLRANKSTPKMGQGWLSDRRWEDEPPAKEAIKSFNPNTGCRQTDANIRAAQAFLEENNE